MAATTRFKPLARCLLQDTCLLQQRRQPRARPAGIADAANEEVQAGVARALQCKIHLVARAGFEVGERQGLRTGDQPADVYALHSLVKAAGLAVVVDKKEVVSRC